MSSSILRHSFVYLIARLATGAVSLGTVVLYTRLLTPEEYGRYALLLSIVGLTSNVLTGWLGEGVVRYYSAERQSQTALLTTVEILRNVLIVPTMIIFGMIAFFHASTEWRPLLGIGALLVWLQSRYDIYLALVRARLQPAHFLQTVLARSIISLAIGWLSIWMGLGALGACLGYCAGVVSLGALYDWRCNLREFSRDTARQLCRYGIPLSINTSLLQIVHSSDRFLLAILLNEKSVGIYAVIYDLTQQTLALFLRSAANASIPLIMGASRRDSTHLALYLRENLALLLTVGLAGVIIFWGAIPELSSTLLPSDYHDYSGTLMALVALATLLIGLRTHHFLLPLMLQERTQLAIVGSAGAAIANLALNLWWIPPLGISGAALATLASYAIALLITVWQVRHVWAKLFPAADVVKISICSLLLVSLYILLPQAHTWLFALGKVVAGGAFFMLGIILFDVASWRSRLWRFVRRLT